MMNSLEMALEVVKTLDAKKAVSIRALQTGGVTSVADYFVICSAQSNTQVKALTENHFFTTEFNSCIHNV